MTQLLFFVAAIAGAQPHGIDPPAEAAALAI